MYRAKSKLFGGLAIVMIALVSPALGANNFTSNVPDNNIDLPSSRSEEVYFSDTNSYMDHKINNITTIAFVPVACPPIPTIPNAESSVSAGSTSLRVNTRVTYACINGYRQVSGNDTITCFQPPPFFPSNKPVRAIWTTPSLNCQIVNCSDPGLVKNAFRTGSSFHYGSNVSYTCEKGYNMTGIPFLFCTKDGRWNRAPPKCLPITCPPYRPHRGVQLMSTAKDGQFHYGSSVLAMCYRRNKGTIKCRHDGTWDLNGFHCPRNPVLDAALCPEIQPLKNGYHNGTLTVGGYPEGSLIRFRCNSNYTLNGAPQIRCRHGSWSSQQPMCVAPKSEPPLKPLSSSSPSSSSSNISTILIILCVLTGSILTALSIILPLRRKNKDKNYWKRYFQNNVSRSESTESCNLEMNSFYKSGRTILVTEL